MTNDRQFRQHNQPEDPLDVLLKRARWPDPTPESLQRLETHWRSVWKWGRIVRLWRPAAAAAAILIALGTVLWWTFPAPKAGAPLPSAVRRTEDRLVVVSRPPTLLERVLILPDIRAAERQREFEQATNLPQRLDEAIDQLVASPQLDAAQLARALLADGNVEFVERRVLQRLRDAPSERRVPAAKLLGEIATQRSLPLLLSLLDDPLTRKAAMPGVIRLAGPRTLAALVSEEKDALTRRRLLAQLTRSDPNRAVPLYLGFIADPETAALALDALKDVPNPPVDEFFAYLHRGKTEQRMAAARALGEVAREEGIRRLIAMTSRGVDRRMALAALICSDDERAVRFVALAEKHPSLASSVRSARSKLDYWTSRKHTKETYHDLQSKDWMDRSSGVGPDA